jgi:ketosteroid isomerase-like protein
MPTVPAQRKPLASRFLSLCIAGAFAGGLAPALVHADEVIEVQSMLAAGKLAEGLKKVDDLLKAKPNDPRLRLQRGIALSLLGRNPEAITVFKKLVETNPELPGPYNNLAVLYANQGDYERARLSLEQAVKANPGYATAYQNLGDIHARLAEKAYAKSLSLDKSDLTLPLKIAAVQNVFESGAPARSSPPQSSGAAPAVVAKAAAPATVSTTAAAPLVKAAAEAPKVADPLTSAVLSNLANPNGKSAAANAAKPAPPTTAVAKPAAPVAAAKADTSASDSQAVRNAVDAWAAAWSKRDMFAYFAAYAPEFKGKAASRKDWEVDRVARISSKKDISVLLSDVQVKLGGNSATVTFKQDYRADALKMKNDKTLVMAKGKTGDWQISSESSN